MYGQNGLLMPSRAFCQMISHGICTFGQNMAKDAPVCTAVNSSATR